MSGRADVHAGLFVDKVVVRWGHKSAHESQSTSLPWNALIARITEPKQAQVHAAENIIFSIVHKRRSQPMLLAWHTA